jgi:hypothetical protein
MKEAEVLLRNLSTCEASEAIIEAVTRALIEHRN